MERAVLEFLVKVINCVYLLYQTLICTLGYFVKLYRISLVYTPESCRANNDKLT